MHVAHNLSSAGVPEGSLQLCILSASQTKLHFLWPLSLYLCMQLKWLFALEMAVCVWEKDGRDNKLPAL